VSEAIRFVLKDKASRHCQLAQSCPYSVVTGNRMARAQTLSSTLGPRLRLGDLRQVRAHFLVGDAVEQMPDQV
jgi:hypothetical protein